MEKKINYFGEAYTVPTRAKCAATAANRPMLLVEYHGKVLQVPLWTRWVAIDRNGDTFAYADKPEISYLHKAWRPVDNNPAGVYLLPRTDLSGIFWDRSEKSINDIIIFK